MLSRTWTHFVAGGVLRWEAGRGVSVAPVDCHARVISAVVAMGATRFRRGSPNARLRVAEAAGRVNKLQTPINGNQNYALAA
jgi:hypothetical protein